MAKRSNTAPVTDEAVSGKQQPASDETASGKQQSTDDEAVGGKQLPTSAEVISGKPLNLRIGPHKSYEALCQLDPGSIVELLSLPDGIAVPEWMPVRFVGGETTVAGWVMAHYMQVIEDGQ